MDWEKHLDRHPAIRQAPGASLVERELRIAPDEEVVELSAVETMRGPALLVLTDKRLLLCSERGIFRRSLAIDYVAHIAQATDAEVRRMGADWGGKYGLRLYTGTEMSPIIFFPNREEATYIFTGLELFVRAYGKPNG